MDRDEFLSLLAQTPAFAALDDARRAHALDKAGRVWDENAARKADLSAKLFALTKETTKRNLQNSLEAFTKHFWKVLEPNQELIWNWHLTELCQVVEAAARGEAWAEQVVINVPPGTLKSLLISVFARGWLWARNAEYRFFVASYSNHLSIRDNIRLRNLVQSEEYQEYFNVTLTDDQRAKVRFDTSAGGWSIATSVGGVGTGEHPDFIFVDDPITEAQSRSEAERNESNLWVDRTLSSRGVVRGVRKLVIMQRFDENDTSGYLVNKGGWTHIRFPMRYEPRRPRTAEDPGYEPDPRDKRTVAGELLMPQLFSEAKVRKLELALGPFGAAGQLQQNPVAEGSGLFQREWFKIVDAGPKSVERRVRGWDTASTEGKGDKTAGVRISEYDGTFYIEDVIGVRVGPNSVEKLIANTAANDGRGCVIREEREGGSAGKAVTALRTKQLVGFDYAGVPTSGDKVTRAKPLRSQIEGGNVKLVRGPWNEAFIQELCVFPAGKEDDYVDAASCAFNSLLLEPKKVKRRATW